MPEQILAQYSIRAKQSYIYKTNQILQITGASENIKNAFVWLIDAAQQQGISIATLPKEPAQNTLSFSVSETKAAFATGALQGVVLFEGGGNLTILFADFAAYQTTTMAFTYACQQKAPGMTPLCVPCAVDFTADDYKTDYARLMQCVNVQKNTMSLGQSFAHAPFSLIDRTTSAPITTIDKSGNHLTAEAAAKIKASHALLAGGTDATITQDGLQTKLLEDLVTNHGEESLLAVVYADGNAMGEKVQAVLADCQGYEASVNKMRAFSAEIEETFVTNGYKAVLNQLAELQRQQGAFSETEELPDDPRYSCRAIIGGGDEITFICNARLALCLARAYLNSLPNGFSSCAGICIFHQKYPVASAYQLAEACCEYAKEKPHAEKDPQKREQCWLDWYYLHSGNGDLETLRERQGVAGCIARPWQTGTAVQNDSQLSALYLLDDTLKAFNISRTNIKTLGAAYEQSLNEFALELSRVYSRNPKLQAALEQVIPSTDRLPKALYDYAECYDLWFASKAME